MSIFADINTPKFWAQTTLFLIFFAWGFGVGTYYGYHKSRGASQASALHSPRCGNEHEDYGCD